MTTERTPEDVIYEQHPSRLRVRRSIEFLNSAGQKGEDATQDDWTPDSAAVSQLKIWTEQDLQALDAAGFVVRPKVDEDTRALAQDRIRLARELADTVGLTADGMEFAAVAPWFLRELAELLAAAYLDGSTDG